MDKEMMIEDIRKEMKEVRAKISALKLDECRRRAEKEAHEALDEARTQKYEYVNLLVAWGFSTFYNCYKQNDESLGGEWVPLKKALKASSEGPEADLAAEAIVEKFKDIYEDSLDAIDYRAVVAKFDGTNRNALLTSQKILFEVKRFVLADLAFEKAKDELHTASKEYSLKRAEGKELLAQEAKLWDELHKLSVERTRERAEEHARTHPREKISSLFPEEREALLKGGVPRSAIMQWSGLGGGILAQRRTT